MEQFKNTLQEAITQAYEEGAYENLQPVTTTDIIVKKLNALQTLSQRNKESLNAFLIYFSGSNVPLEHANARESEPIGWLNQVLAFIEELENSQHETTIIIEQLRKQ